MRERLLALAARRALLVARAQAERETMAGLLAHTDGIAALAVTVFRAARKLIDQARGHPLFTVAGVALLVALRPRRAVAWLARGWSLWRLYRGAYGWWQRFATTASAPSGKAISSD